MNEKYFNLSELTVNQRNEILTRIKKYYLDRVKIIKIDNKKHIFSWCNIPLTVYVVQYPNSDYPNFSNLLIFLVDESNKSDSIKIINIEDSINDDYEFIKPMINDEEKIQILINKGYLNDDLTIIKGSISKISLTNNSFNDFKNNMLIKNSIESVVDREYKNVRDSLSQNTVNTINYKKELLFAGSEDFNLIIDSVKDKYFQRDLSECLFAYDNQKWFLCAAGLGSVIEQIMIITIRNYKDSALDKTIKKDPTASNLKAAFKKSPINADEKQIMRIKQLFDVRNKMDHFSTGFAIKDDADFLLDGIITIYNEFYIPSVNYKK